VAKPSRGTLLWAAAGCLAAAALAHAGAQSFPWQSPHSAETPGVRFLYPEQIHIAANQPVAVELHFRIRDGLHINAHVPAQKSLIPTNLIVAEPNGLRVAAVSFPPGLEYTLKAFPGEKLLVYTGELVLNAHVSATPGEHMLQADLRYQACDTDSCYPPKMAPVALDVIAR
jgi:hypothetical protein